MKKYIKPVLKANNKNDFISLIIKAQTKVPLTCRQCSSCHSCRG